MKKATGLSLCVAFVCAIALFTLSPRAQCPGEQPTVTTDKADYAPGSTVFITGTGFGANDLVTLQVLHADKSGDNDTSGAHASWNVAADGNGNFQAIWLVPADEDELGATLQLTAVGSPSGLIATTTFTDDCNKIGAIAVLNQRPKPVPPGGIA